MLKHLGVTEITWKWTANRVYSSQSAYCTQFVRRFCTFNSRAIWKAKAEGKYRGRVADAQKHELIRTLRLAHGKSLRETARLAGVSKMTVIRVCSNVEDQGA